MGLNIVHPEGKVTCITYHTVLNNINADRLYSSPRRRYSISFDMMKIQTVVLSTVCELLLSRMFKLISCSSGKPFTGRCKPFHRNNSCQTSDCHTAHQLRVHLQFLGHPIANDPVYSEKRIWVSPGSHSAVVLALNML